MLSDTALVVICIIAISGFLFLGSTLSHLLNYLEEIHRQAHETEMAKLGLTYNDDLERWVPYGQGEEQPDKPNEGELRTPVPPLAPEA
jgi:hypothetical protein